MRTCLSQIVPLSGPAGMVAAVESGRQLIWCATARLLDLRVTGRLDEFVPGKGSARRVRSTPRPGLGPTEVWLRVTPTGIVTANPDSATRRVGCVSQFTLPAVSLILSELVMPLV